MSEKDWIIKTEKTLKRGQKKVKTMDMSLSTICEAHLEAIQNLLHHIEDQEVYLTMDNVVTYLSGEIPRDIPIWDGGEDVDERNDRCDKCTVRRALGYDSCPKHVVGPDRAPQSEDMEGYINQEINDGLVRIAQQVCKLAYISGGCEVDMSDMCEIIETVPSASVKPILLPRTVCGHVMQKGRICKKTTTGGKCKAHERVVANAEKKKKAVAAKPRNNGGGKGYSRYAKYTESDEDNGEDNVDEDVSRG